MARPPKSAKIIKMEKRSHRTKKELATREKAEQNLITGAKLKESPRVKADPVAHKEYTRVRKILRAIEKDDDLYSGTINMYCELGSEIQRMTEESEEQRHDIEDLKGRKDTFEDPEAYYELLSTMRKRLDNLDRRIDQKRKIRMSIERENGMTISSALRAVPKKPDQNKSELKKALYGA